MDETQTLAARTLRELLDNPERDDWDELLAANRALLKAIETGKPMTPKNVRIVAEYLREAGWRERAIGAATAQAGVYAGTGNKRTRRPMAQSRRGLKIVEAGLDGEATVARPRFEVIPLA
jgi:hypothetical protein